MRNEIGKQTFLMAIQHYMPEEPQLVIRWVCSHPERRKEMGEYDLDDGGIYIADCFVSNKPHHDTSPETPAWSMRNSWCEMIFQCSYGIKATPRVYQSWQISNDAIKTNE